MFFKRDRRKKRGVGVFRLILSLLMLSVLSLGVYSAYKSFSGVDPLKISPKSAVNSALGSESVFNFITGLLSFSPRSVIGGLNPNQIIPADTNTSKSINGVNQTTSKPTTIPTPKPKLLFSFAIVADSENDNDDLAKALTQAKAKGAALIVGLGDFSDVGTVAELTAAKAKFDEVGVPYYLIPGDHDLWDSRNRGLGATTDYNQVFGKNYSSFNYQNVHFLLVDNSDNYHGVQSSEMQFIQQDLFANQASELRLVFVSTPLYHPSSDHVMGDVEPSLKIQAALLTGLFKQENVAEVFAGDTHFYSNYIEPSHNLNMVAVGAITAFRNLQGPRFTMVDVFDDGSYNIQDTEVAP